MPKALPVVDATAPLCCGPLAGGAMSPDDALEVAVRLKALADPVRVQIMSILLAEAGTGVCTCDLAPSVRLSEPTVSHHLRVLRQAGLVDATRQGANTWYRPKSDALAALAEALDPRWPAANRSCSRSVPHRITQS